MEYKNPCSTVDVIVERDNQILLIRRKHEPFKDIWALPGGFLEYGKETLEEAAARELGEETSLQVTLNDLELFGVYSTPNRDPRGHVISHVYIAKKFSGTARAKDDTIDVRFHPLENLPELAFDHKEIIVHYQELKGGKK